MTAQLTDEQVARVRSVVGHELLDADLAALSEAYANYVRGVQQLRAIGLEAPAPRSFEVLWPS
jgi:hypothetical protein